MNAHTDSERYTRVAIALHWTIALAVIGLIAVGLWMTRVEPGAATFAAYQAHKTFGILVLFLTLARLGWRLLHKAPPLPDGMNAMERLAANGAHLGFYFLLFALPLSGWAMVSASTVGVPTYLFGALHWPHLPLTPGESLSGLLHETHEILAYGAIALVGLHVAAAMKHQFFNQDGLLARMWPFNGRTSHTSNSAVSAASLAIPFALFMGLLWIGREPSSAQPADSSSAPAEAIAVGDWLVDPEQSSITFAGTNSGEAFEGVFDQWTAEVRFDPNDLDNASVVVTVDMTTATTGNNYYDGTLATGEWLNTGDYPQATFVTRGFSAEADGSFVTEADLTIKETTVTATAPFTVEIDGDNATASGSTVLDRTALDIGMTSDPSASWVSKDITVTFNVVATRAP